MANYLDDLLGIKTVRALGSAPVPQRAALSFEGEGVTLEDNPLLEQTEVTFGAGGGDGALVALDVSLDTDDVGDSAPILAHAELAAAELVRVTVLNDDGSDYALGGMDAAGLTAFHKTLVNLGPVSLYLINDHGDTAPTNRFRFPAGVDITVAVDQSIDLVYVAARATTPPVLAGWRAVL